MFLVNPCSWSDQHALLLNFTAGGQQFIVSAKTYYQFCDTAAAVGATQTPPMLSRYVCTQLLYMLVLRTQWQTDTIKVLLLLKGM